MAGRVTGAAELMLVLRQLGPRAVRRAREQMKRESEKIADLARDYAPVDHDGPTKGQPPGHELERSIRAEKDYEDNRRLKISVVAGGRVGDVDVDEYATLMHEGLGPYGSGAYRPGPGTLAKGPQAGGKFLERAHKERETHMIADITAEVLKEIP